MSFISFATFSQFHTQTDPDIFVCFSSGYEGEGAESAGVNFKVYRAAGPPLHVHLFPRHPQLSFSTCWR